MNLKPAIALIKKHEGLRLHAYLCPAGKPTIGWGTTRGVQMGMVIDQHTAEGLLMSDVLKVYLPAIKNNVKVEINDNEACALISLVYNIGETRFQKSTLLSLLNGGSPRNYVADQFGRWVMAKGKRLRGLMIRREEERLLFLTPPVDMLIV